MLNIIDYEIDKQIKRLDSYLYANRHKEVVFFCPGNYKIWYDSFAPELAENLRNNAKVRCFVYGGIDNKILPSNLIEYMDFIENKHPGAYIIVVDNCLSVDGKNELVINSRKTIPAAAVNFRSFGDLSILLKTNYKSNCFDFLSVQNKVIHKISQYFANFA